MTAWFALSVRSRHEKSVRAQLEAREQTVFLPLYNRKTKWADRWKVVQLPLFPGYVFCRFQTSDRSSILATSGVIDVVRFGPQPAPIESSEIEAIQRIVNSALEVEPHAGLVMGDRVVISEGPLRGLSGKILEVRKGLRLVVSVELLRRSVLVDVDRAWVAPAEPYDADPVPTSLYAQLQNKHLNPPLHRSGIEDFNVA